VRLAALHFPQEIGIHVENKASHREILDAAYLMWGTRGSTLLVRVEDVVLRLHGRMARVSTV
jgi:hypothetical protein